MGSLLKPVETTECTSFALGFEKPTFGKNSYCKGTVVYNWLKSLILCYT